MPLQTAILILNCNGIADTRTCLHSLARDGFSEKEILVLDNGSALNEREILEREFPAGVRFLRSEKNLGYAGGNNFLAGQTDADVVVFLNNDTEVTAGWLTPLLDAFAEPGTAACQPKLLSWNDRTRFDYAGGCGGFLDALGFHYIRGSIYGTIEKDEGQYDDAIDVDWASGAAFAVRRDVFLATGGFDATFFAYMEEVDLCWRLRGRGYRILCNPASVVFHKGGRTLRRQPAYKRFLGHRNNLLMLAKNLPPARACVIVPLRLALEWAACGYYLLSGQWRFAAAPAASFFSFFLHLPAALRKHERLRTPRPAVWSIVFAYFLLGRTTWSCVMRKDL